MGDEGLEPQNLTHCSDKQLETRHIQGAALSGAVDAESTPTDPDLHRIIDAWPMLPKAVRAGIQAMVKAAAPERKER